MVQGKWYPMGAEIALPLSIRQAALGHGRDALDDAAWQVVVYADDTTPVGCGRLWWQEGAFHLGEVGVLAGWRGQGFGDLLTRLLLFKALTHSAAVIRLTAPEAAAPFFARYGFQADAPCGGLVPMSIRGEDVRLSHCDGHCESCAVCTR